MRIPVLTYHAVNIDGNDYADNDHVAFASDLRLIHGLGLRIVPLQLVADVLRGVRDDDLSRCVALSCDDGADFDFFDLDHPVHGMQRSLFNAMIDFRHAHGRAAQPQLHLTSFVIASPQARNVLDRECLAGRDWMRHTWWRAAQASGLMAIECHSWEHNHPALPDDGPEGMARGSFNDVDTATRAEHEIARAVTYLNERLAPRTTRQLAWPFGQSNPFLREQYMPSRGVELGLEAAWSTEAAPVQRSSDIWNLPRYVCGWHWRTPGELVDILREAMA